MLSPQRLEQIHCCMQSPVVLFKGIMVDEGDISEITDDQSFVVEVTEADHADKVSQSPHRRLVSSLRKQHSPRQRPPRNVQVQEEDGGPHSDDGAAHTVSYNTVASHETVKASNKTKKKEGRWTKIKRMMLGSPNKRSASSSGPLLSSHHPDKESAVVVQPPKSSPLLFTPKKKRSSDGGFSIRVRSSPQKTAETTALEESSAAEDMMTNDSIRGRLDGIDVISLGSALTVSAPRQQQQPHDDDDFPNLSFVGDSFEQSPADLVRNMLWKYGERNPPEMILEGYVPGGNDRWTVRIEPRGQQRQQQQRPNKQQNGDHHHHVEDGGSPPVSSQELWNSLWGSDPTPSNTADDLEKYESSEDPVMLLAAECSVPIDLDEDTFIISTPQHFRAIHEIIVLPLSVGNFDLAIGILTKLWQGLKLLENDDFDFLKGTTLHNIGLIHLWKGEYETALKWFQQAVDERAKTLPKNHSDTVVSLVRKATTLFALERFDEAVAAFEVAIPMMPRDHIVQAKVQNNLGAAYYQQMDFTAALKQFTLSLDTQRAWLETTVRRETLVFDTSVTLSNIGKVYMERSDSDLACDAYEEALLLQTTMFRKDSATVLDTLMSLAIAKARAGQVENALQILKGCLRAKREKFGKESAPAVELIGLMGFLYAKMESFEEAERNLSVVEDWQEKNLARNHPSCQQTEEIVEAIEAGLGRKLSVWV